MDSGKSHFEASKTKFLIRDFKKKINEVEVVENIKPTTTFYAIQEI